MRSRRAAALASVLAVGATLALVPSPSHAMPPLDGPRPGSVAVIQSSGPVRPAGVDQPTPRTAVSGTWKTLVILIDFLDYHWDNGHDPYFANADSTGTYTQPHFANMLFSDNSYRDPFAASAYTGSLRDYYRECSYGQFLVSGTVTLWYRAPHTYRYYCNTDRVSGTADDYGWAKSDSGWVQDLVRDAVTAANPLVNFAQFDNDGNGYVDGLFVVHAGPGAEAVYSISPDASRSYIWSHKWSIPAMAVDGVSVTNYTMEPEDGTIGVFCHEFGHDLGLPDIYDTDGSSEGIGEWDVMGSGGWCHRVGDPNGTCPAHFSAWSKKKLGWVTPVNVTAARVGEVIPPVETSGTVYRIWAGGAVGNEYFLLENREPVGFDAGLTRRQCDYALPISAGLMIYHVDDGAPNNDTDTHRLIDVEDATPYWTGSRWFEQLDGPRLRPADLYLSNANRGDDGDTWPGWSGMNGDGTDYVGSRSRTAFGAGTVPNSNAYSGAITGVSVTDIALSGTNVIASLYSATPTAIARDGAAGADFALRPVAVAGPATGVQVVLTLAAPRRAVTLRVYDAAGRVARELFRGSLEAGEHRFAWDGRRADGRTAGAGIYVVRADAAAEEGRSAAVTERRAIVVR